MRIKMNTIIIFVYLLPFIPIYIINSDNYIDMILYLKIFFGYLGCISIPFILKRNRYIFLSIALFCILSSLRYGNDMTKWINSTYIIGFYGTIIYFFQFHKDDLFYTLMLIAKLIIMLYVVFSIINLLLASTDPILFNNHNGIQIYCTFVIGAILLYTNYRSKSLNRTDKLSIMIAILAMIISKSSTGFLAGLVGLYMLFNYNKVSLFQLFVFYLIAFFICILSQFTNVTFINIMFDLFGKTTNTFTNRWWRWEFSFEIIKNNLFFSTNNLEELASLYAGYTVEYFNPHNALLYLFVNSGALGTIVYINMIIKCIKSKIDNNLNAFFIVVCSISLITGLMESNSGFNNIVFSLFLVIELLMIGEFEYENKFKNKLSK